MNKKIIFAIGGVLIVALLAGAAYMGVRLLNARAASDPGLPAAVQAGVSAAKGGGNYKEVTIKMERAPELPQQPAALGGEVAEINGNSVFVNPATKFSSPGQSSGPAVEVVITKDTKIWRDITMESMGGKPPADAQSNLTLQQKVEPAAADQIVQGYMVSIWGQKRGDRLIADEIVVMGPAVVYKK